MSLHWSQEKSLELIIEFHTHEVLWNSKFEYYFNNAKKEEAWQEISANMNVDVDELKRKMDSLKGSYRREKHRERKSLKYLDGHAYNSYTSNWFAYKYMKFFDAVRYEPDSAISEIRFPQEHFSGIDIKIEPDFEDNIPEPELILITNNEGMQIDRQLLDNQENTTRTSRKLPFRRRRKLVTTKYDERKMWKMCSFMKNAKFVQKDECSAYGQYIATKLRKLDDRLRAEVQLQFNKIIYEAEMSQYRN